jgi:hypothetical protein
MSQARSASRLKWFSCANGMDQANQVLPVNGLTLFGGIRDVSPAQRHDGEDATTLAARPEVHLQARERNPARWSGKKRSGRTWRPSRSTRNAIRCSPRRRVTKIFSRWLLGRGDKRLGAS